jgi:UDP-N-acetylglucosamine 2-epimerase (non-hydrolysing)
MCVAGARPNFMKIKPVIDAAESRGLDTLLVHTGQHYDEAMSDVFFDDLGLRAPDFHLEVGSGTHAEQSARVMLAFEPLVARERPDVVVVVGDVNSTLGCALVVAKSRSALAHVEAGLRSGDWEMPEEINRVVTDRVSDLLFAPSDDAVANLLAEGVPSRRIHLVGNVMIDTLLANLPRARARARAALDALGLEPNRYGLVTLHRPANVDSPAVLDQLLMALTRVAAELPLLFPAHPRVAARLAARPPIDGLRVVEPMGYLDFLALESNTRLVLTDSGGVQEETTALGIPCLTLRENTERPVTVEIGTNRVVGRDPTRIAEGVTAALEGHIRGEIPPLWDGRAAERIVDALVRSGGGPARPE